MDERWVGVFASVAAVVVVATLALGAGPPLALVTAGALVVGVVAFFSTRRNDRPSEYVYTDNDAPQAWTWWTCLAAALAGVYVIAASAQLIGDPKADHVGGFAIMAGFAGLVAGVYVCGPEAGSAATG